MSASATCGLILSASEYTATVAMPMERAVRMILRAISPRLATSRVWTGVIVGEGRLIGASSHPEDAVAARPGDRLVVDDRQAHAEHRAGVPRVDDAVVVEAGGEEQG